MNAVYQRREITLWRLSTASYGCRSFIQGNIIVYFCFCQWKLQNVQNFVRIILKITSSIRLLRLIPKHVQYSLRNQQHETQSTLPLIPILFLEFEGSPKSIPMYMMHVVLDAWRSQHLQPRQQHDCQVFKIQGSQKCSCVNCQVASTTL